MTTIITSVFGNVVIDNESFAVYTSKEELCDEMGNTVSPDNPHAMHVADLIIETVSQRFIFKKLYLAVDYALEIRAFMEACAYNNQEVVHMELNELLDFIEPEMIGSKRIIVENKEEYEMSAYTPIFDAEMEDNLTYKDSEYWIKNGVLLAYYGMSTNPEIPEGVTVIAEDVFAHSCIMRLKCPSTLKKIEARAFACNDLIEITLNNGLECIGDQAFIHCPCINKVAFPDSIKVIGSKAFAYTNIRNIVLPDMLYVSVDAFMATPFAERAREAMYNFYKEDFNDE